MKLAFIALSFLFIFNSQATERSPFTKVNYGAFLGWGDFIQVTNYDYWDEDKTHYLIEVEGKGYKEILSEVRAIHGDNYKCRLAEHFVETMAEIGIKTGDTINLKLYTFKGHKQFYVNNVPVTEDNLAEIQFETNHCR